MTTNVLRFRQVRSYVLLKCNNNRVINYQQFTRTPYGRHITIHRPLGGSEDKNDKIVTSKF